MPTPKKQAQQEIVGFVLIVVLVIVGLMIFLIVSLRDGGEIPESIEAENLLNSIMSATTNCAIPGEPYYYDFEELFKGCYENERCSNLDRMACDYLNESLREVVDSLLLSEARISAYQIDFLSKDELEENGILRIFRGNCTGTAVSAQRNLVSGGDSLIVRIKICSLS